MTPPALEPDSPRQLTDVPLRIAGRTMNRMNGGLKTLHRELGGGGRIRRVG
jgi:hypothetical protein